MSTESTGLSVTELAEQLDELREQLAAVKAIADKAADRAAVENVFNRYMHLHNAFEDEQIVGLWVKQGTPGIRARYTNAGQYTDYDSVMHYHRGRPRPVGKLILHYTTTPVIEVAADGETAKGVWIMAGTESGLTDPAMISPDQADMYSAAEVRGKRVWAHWVWAKYAIDFLKQDGEWRIWKFRCYELVRTPFEENWISSADKNEAFYDLDVMYYGENGRPVYMPKPDEPVDSVYLPFTLSRSQTLDPVPPTPYESFSDTFR